MKIAVIWAAIFVSENQMLHPVVYGYVVYAFFCVKQQGQVGRLLITR